MLAEHSEAKLRDAGVSVAPEPGGQHGAPPPGRKTKTSQEYQAEHLKQWRRIPKSRMARVIKKTLAAAEAGEPWAVQLVRDMTAGKPAQAVELKAEEGYVPLVVALPPGIVDPDVVDGESRPLDAPPALPEPEPPAAHRGPQPGASR